MRVRITARQRRSIESTVRQSRGADSVFLAYAANAVSVYAVHADRAYHVGTYTAETIRRVTS